MLVVDGLGLALQLRNNAMTLGYGQSGTKSTGKRPQSLIPFTPENSIGHK